MYPRFFQLARGPWIANVTLFFCFRRRGPQGQINIPQSTRFNELEHYVRFLFKYRHSSLLFHFPRNDTPFLLSSDLAVNTYDLISILEIDQV